tara:strand:- start:2033 stop:2788 length:756 start_codon:yes stop_codon:yes gene_type:complete
MSENKQIAGGGPESRDQILDELFKNTSEETLTITDLPSKGKFYEGFQGVEVSPLTYLDEQNILGSRDPNGDLVSKLLAKSVKGVVIDDLLSMDKMFLLMKVREVSYGETYDFNITCPSCKTDVKTSLILSENLNMNEVPDDLTDPREVELPKLKTKASVRFPRSREEIFLKDSETVYKNLYRFVISINDNSDPVFISKALKRMHLQDIKKLISEVTKGEYGIDPRFIFQCPSCGHEETMAVPMDVGFFSVS